MNSGNPHLSLTLSPPIGWERRGNPSSGRLRRDRQQVDAGRRLEAAQDEAGFGEGGCRIYPAFRFLRVKPGDPHLSLTLSPPIGWERRGNPSWARLRRDRQQVDAICRLNVKASAAGSRVQYANFFGQISPRRGPSALRFDATGEREAGAKMLRGLFTFNFQLPAIKLPPCRFWF